MSDSDTSTDEDENNELDNIDYSGGGKAMCAAKLIRNHAISISIDLQDNIIIDITFIISSLSFYERQCY
jgi:hypothetical protein